MQTDNRLFDDMSRLAQGAVGTLTGLGKEMEAMMRQRFERFIGGLDLVSREEFDAVKAMAEAARTENETLSVRLAALEAKVGDKS
jgi:BMFP domain-containing protein YqiC